MGIVEIEGLQQTAERAIVMSKTICERNRARQTKIANDESERQTLWRARKGAFGAMGTLAQLPGSTFYRRIREKFGRLAH